ncbi:DUF4190 domain-containing protein [Microbacteriaceae bacterium VKM Ac-2855]|nr:DUF4190 domain-containing protein [Microbacteriaceae bacterium VKM Ac-2855]
MSTETPSPRSTSTGTDQNASGIDPWSPTAEYIGEAEQQPAQQQQPTQPQQSAPIAPPAPYAGAYGTPGYGAPVAPTAGFSITSLVLGVSSIFFGLTFIAPIAGLVFGILALKREPHGRTMAIWGIVLNSAMLVFAAILVVLVLVFALGIPFFALADPSNY